MTSNMLPIFIFFAVCEASSIFYDSYTGLPITREDVKRHDKANNTFWCVTEVKPCDPAEGRRVDGTCNNLLNPPRGSFHTPFYRVLNPVFGKNFEPKPAKSGRKLPLPRYLRTKIVSTGSVPDPTFTMLATHFFVYMSTDVVSLQDTVNYVLWKPYCCTERGKTDRMCAPNKIPDDDPVHRFSNYRCLNMTRPETFQSVGCVKNDTVPERIVSATPLMDMSNLYGNTEKNLNQKGRKFEGGLLKTEILNGRIWPPSTKAAVGVCMLNQKPAETRCHDTPEDGTNSLLSVNIMSILFWRHHNMIATELARINPCWDDEKLFNTAREINIATILQIFYYELMPAMLGYENLVNDGVITPLGGFRDMYDDQIIPQVSLEYPFVLRWVHTLQEGTLKMYDKDGYYTKQFPIVNLTLRTGYLTLDDNLDSIVQGSFRQGCAKIDHVADPDITDNGLGGLQKTTDIMTSDLSKNRHFGFPPYIKYVEFCFGKKIRTFEDLINFMDPERIEILKNVYENVEDIDLMAALWSERKVRGGYVPPTFYCLVIDQLLRNIISDRFWYERPIVFTIEQLTEIRKASIARLLCDTGDTVTRIQAQAFFKASNVNPMVSCDYINKIDYFPWKDVSCDPPTVWDTVPWDFKQDLVQKKEEEKPAQ